MCFVLDSHYFVAAEFQKRNVCYCELHCYSYIPFFSTAYLRISSNRQNILSGYNDTDSQFKCKLQVAI